MIAKRMQTKIIKDKIKKVLENYPIVFAYLFGSSARGKTGALSDVDIAVYFENQISEKDRFNLKLDLIDKFQKVFQKNTQKSTRRTIVRFGYRRRGESQLFAIF